jgi:hypothetical protein
MGSKWAEDDEVLASYLGILVYFYESLQTKYSGKVRNVPHPHIRKETEEFRNRQDRVNNFLNKFLVKSSDEENEMSMEIAKERYIKWHESQYPGSNKEYQRHAIDQLENSKIQAFIKKSRRGTFLKGYRILDLNEDPADDETYYTDIHERDEQDTNLITKESASELLTRLRSEYDNTKTTCAIAGNSFKTELIAGNSFKTELIAGNSFKTELIAGNSFKTTKSSENILDDSDSDIEDIIENIKKTEPKKSFKFKIDNVVVSDLDINGIKLPKKNGSIKAVNCKEFVINNGSEDESSDSENSKDE